MTTRLAAKEIAALDPYKFMAVIGTRVIHPGGRASTESLLGRAQITETSRVLDVGCGVATTAVEIAKRHGASVTAVDISPVMLVTMFVDRSRAANEPTRVTKPGGRVLATEFFWHLSPADQAKESLGILGRVASRPAHMKKMAWLMPRMAKAVPYLGYIVVAGTKPA